MNSRLLSPWVLFGLWLGLVLTALLTRPLLPVDETRYLAVAWEMWSRGDFLVPYLNGETYSHKPPLLFWLFHAGWAVFGVNEWWPRLVAPLISLANLLLTWRLARALWPEEVEAARIAPWLLFGGLLWSGFFTVVQFDLLIVFCTLLGMLGLLHSSQGKGSGWLLVGLAIGLGVLAKGPVILLHLLPVALLGYFWVDRSKLKGWHCWYLGTLSALILGTGIALLWALPASVAGGEAYRDAIFWGQTADRVVNSFAHKQPLWWYLPQLPLALLPWTLWMPVWRGLARLNVRADRALRFCLAWLLPVFIAFSFISGKQIKYLLPLFPVIALIMAHGLSRLPTTPWRLRLPALLLVAVGVLLMALPWQAQQRELVAWLQAVYWAWGLLPLLAGLALLVLKPQPRGRALALAGMIGGLLVVTVHVGVIRLGAPAYDMGPVSRHIASLQARGERIASADKYHGQYHFAGRLQQPVVFIDKGEEQAWMQKHPQAHVLVDYDGARGQLPQAEAVWPFRGNTLVMWRAETLLAHPQWLRELPAETGETQ